MPSPDAPVSSSDPKQVKERTARAKDQQKQDREDLKALLQTQEGQRFMRGLLAECGIYRLSFHTNAIQMAFNEGNRNIGNKLIKRISDACPEFIVDLLKVDQTT